MMRNTPEPDQPGSASPVTTPAPVGRAIGWLIGGTVIALIVQVVLLAQAWGSLPELVPLRFALSGDANTTGSKWMLLLIPVASATIMVIPLVTRARPDLISLPWTTSPEHHGRQIVLTQFFVAWLMFLACAILTVITWQILRVASGKQSGIPAALGPVSFALLLGSTAVYLWLARRSR